MDWQTPADKPELHVKEVKSGEEAIKLLALAKQAIDERGENYGDPARSFAMVADIWTHIVGAKVTPEMVILCMCALKMSRLIESPDHYDSAVDLAGYAAIYGEITKNVDH